MTNEFQYYCYLWYILTLKLKRSFVFQHCIFLSFCLFIISKVRYKSLHIDTHTTEVIAFVGLVSGFALRDLTENITPPPKKKKKTQLKSLSLLHETHTHTFRHTTIHHCDQARNELELAGHTSSSLSLLKTDENTPKHTPL